MNSKYKTPGQEAAAKGCTTGCISYIIVFFILTAILDENTAVGVSLFICSFIGFGAYKNFLSKLKQENKEIKAEQQKFEKKEQERIEEKLDQIKDDQTEEVIEETKEETEEEQRKRYLKYLDNIKKKNK